jgi:tetratricopeptide (TPR) repeat protein
MVRAMPAQRPRTQGGPSRAVVNELRATAPPGKADRAGQSFARAVDLLERGRPAAAIAPAEEAKRLAPRSGAVRELLGLALYRAERYRDALRELQAYRRVTGRADQNHLIADSHRALGSPEKAVEAAREALRAPIPEEARAEAAIVGAAALADLGRFAEALGLLRGVASRGPKVRAFDLRVWYVTGDVLERAGRPAEAKDEFRRVLRHEPGAFDAAERLARLG